MGGLGLLGLWVSQLVGAGQGGQAELGVTGSPVRGLRQSDMPAAPLYSGGLALNRFLPSVESSV